MKYEVRDQDQRGAVGKLFSLGAAEMARRMLAKRKYAGT